MSDERRFWSREASFAQRYGFGDVWARQPPVSLKPLDRLYLQVDLAAGDRWRGCLPVDSSKLSDIEPWVPPERRVGLDDEGRPW